MTTRQRNTKADVRTDEAVKKSADLTPSRADKPDEEVTTRPAQQTPLRMSGKEMGVLFGVLSLAVCLSMLVLWGMGALGPRTWSNVGGSQMTHVQGSMSELTEFLDAHADEHVVVALYSSSCPQCSRMRKPFLKISREYEGVHFVAVNAYKSLPIAKAFDVQFVPHIVFLRNGDIGDIGRVYKGGARVDKLRQFIDAQLRD